MFGDGVNIAARLEGLAEPGSVVISGTVHEHVRAKLDFGFEDLGPQEVKNIAEPVHAYCVVKTPSLTKSTDDPLPCTPGSLGSTTRRRTSSCRSTCCQIHGIGRSPIFSCPAKGIPVTGSLSLDDVGRRFHIRLFYDHNRKRRFSAVSTTCLVSFFAYYRNRGLKELVMLAEVMLAEQNT